MIFRCIFCFRFWLTFLSFLVVMIHALGYDPDSALLYLFSPPAWIVQGVIKGPDLFSFVYVAAPGFWFMMGFLVDLKLGLPRGEKKDE